MLSCGLQIGPADPQPYTISRKAPPLGLYTILPVPILYGTYCNTGWSGGSTVLRNSVGDEGGEWGAQPKGVFAGDSIDSCTKASNYTNIL